MKFYNLSINVKRIILILFVFFSISYHSIAQEWSGLLDKKEQSVGFETGFDNSIMPINFSYKRGFDLFNTKYPLIAGLDITVPLFGFDFNDVKVRILTETTIFRNKNFEIRGGLNPVFINVNTKTESISSLGCEFHTFIGYIDKKWNTGLEFSYNQIFTSYIKHTEYFKNYIFSDVKDGWYKATAANVRMGVVVNLRIKKFDIYFKGGMFATGKFKTYLMMPPLYFDFGLSFRF